MSSLCSVWHEIEITYMNLTRCIELFYEKSTGCMNELLEYLKNVISFYNLLLKLSIVY